MFQTSGKNEIFIYMQIKMKNQFLRVIKWKIFLKKNLFLRMANIYLFLRIWAK